MSFFSGIFCHLSHIHIGHKHIELLLYPLSNYIHLYPLSVEFKFVPF